MGALDLSERITMIPLRKDVKVRFLDIPHDLTPKEAAKIGNVIRALATHNRSG